MRSFNSVMRSVNSVMRSSHYVLLVCALFMRSFYVLFLFAPLLCPLYSLFLCSLFMYSFYPLVYELFVFAVFMSSFLHWFYVLFLCALFIRLFSALFSWAILMCSFHKRLAILHMHKKYYCTQTSIADNKMDKVLNKLGLSDHRVRLVEKNISTDIVCYLSIENFLKLGLTDRNAIMSLRTECSTFGLCTSHKGQLELNNL